jgi:hypothetical protein
MIILRVHNTIAEIMMLILATSSWILYPLLFCLAGQAIKNKIILNLFWKEFTIFFKRDPPPLSFFIKYFSTEL